MQVAPAELHLARHARLREALRAASLDALVVTSLPNIAYLTGLFASTAAVIVSANQLRLLIDGRYLAPAQTRLTELPGLELSLVPAAGSFEEAMVDLLAGDGATMKL